MIAIIWLSVSFWQWTLLSFPFCLRWHVGAFQLGTLTPLWLGFCFGCHGNYSSCHCGRLLSFHEDMVTSVQSLTAPLTHFFWTTSLSRFSLAMTVQASILADSLIHPFWASTKAFSPSLLLLLVNYSVLLVFIVQSYLYFYNIDNFSNGLLFSFRQFFNFCSVFRDYWIVCTSYFWDIMDF